MLKSRHRSSLAVLLVALGVVMSSCVSSGGSSGAPQSGQVEGQPKIMTIGVARFVNVLQRRVVGAVAGAGEPGIFWIAHDDLKAINAGADSPRLATKLPALADGDWVLNPGGSMDVTWKLRPNVKWHDGAPFTSADLTFAFQVYKDPELPSEYQGRNFRLMESVSAPDPYTFVVHWGRPFVEGTDVGGLHPMPRHLLDETYRTNKASLEGHPAWSSQFVGLGPYKMERWEDGYQVQFVRFDDYWQGRPPLDRVIVRVIADGNTLVANILAGEIDVILPISITLDAAAELRDSGWDGQVLPFLDLPSLRRFDIQFRPERARPTNGLINLRVRQAMYQAIDRDAMAAVITARMAPRADTWFAPNDPDYVKIESAIPRYPYDPARARTLLVEAGWTPGPDGKLIDQATGQRLEIEIRGEPSFQREALIMQNDWQAIGAEPFVHNIPAALAGDREQKTLTTGGAFTNGQYQALLDTHNSGRIPSAENRFTGTNSGGYHVPEHDALMIRMSSAIDPDERIQLHRQMMTEFLANLPAYPLFFTPQAVQAVKSVTGIRGTTTFNMFEWNKQSLR